MLGSQPSLHREHVLQDQAEHEDRDRDPDQRADEARVVERRPVLLGGHEAERDAEQDAKIIAAISSSIVAGKRCSSSR